MSGGMDRRKAMARIAALALLPVLARGEPAEATISGPFSPPSEPMLFTRKLRRDLAPGAVIEVVRRFEIRFVRNEAGFRVEGRELGCDVSAPQSLAMLAQIEQRRKEDGLFPMQLDPGGMIVSGPLGPAAPESVALAVDEALARIGRSHLPAGDRANAREFVLGIQMLGSGLTSRLPPRLFTGFGETSQEQRDLPLPDGGFGQLRVTVSAVPGPRGNLFDHGERVVVTQVGGSERRWVEQWTLTPLSMVGR